MLRFFRVLSALFVAIELVDSRGTLYYKEDEAFDGSVCSGTANSIPPWYGQPTFVRQIANGTLYTAGDGEDMIYGKSFSYLKILLDYV